MSALQPNSFLINFSLKPCTKVTTSSLQSVLIFALYPIVAGFTSLLFFIPLASVHLCCCFKDAGKICLCIVFHFLLSSSHSSVDISKDLCQMFLWFIYIISEDTAVPYLSISQPSEVNLPSSSWEVVNERF